MGSKGITSLTSFFNLSTGLPTVTTTLVHETNRASGASASIFVLHVQLTLCMAEMFC